MDILTERIPEFVNYHPLVQLLPSYVKETTHLLNILKEIDVLSTNALLVTLVVTITHRSNRMKLK